MKVVNLAASEVLDAADWIEHHAEQGAQAVVAVVVGADGQIGAHVFGDMEYSQLYTIGGYLAHVAMSAMISGRGDDQA